MLLLQWFCISALKHCSEATIKRESTNVIGCEEDTDIKDKNKWQIDSNTLIAESKY